MQGLVSTKDVEIRRRILNKLENEPNITLQQIADDCQRYDSVKQDSKKIEESGIAHIRKICYDKQTKSPTKSDESKQTKSPTKSKESKKKKKYLSPNPLDVELYTGTKIVLSGKEMFYL